MTWFETEQIVGYINDLAEELEDWALDNIQMRVARSRLIRLHQKLQTELAHHPQSAQTDILRHLLQQTHRFNRCINERLKH